jgi:hypothetical protein
MNFETRVVRDWLLESGKDYWLQQAIEEVRTPQYGRNGILNQETEFARNNRVRATLAERLEVALEQQIDELLGDYNQAGWMADLLRNAYSEVVWGDLAQTFMDLEADLSDAI